MKKNLLGILLCFLSIGAYAQADSVAQLANLSLEELMNVQVVTASGYMQKPSEAPATIKVITAGQISDRGYEQLSDVLRDVPGIDMIHLNGYAPTLIYFRGMYGAENLRALLMIDGVIANNIVGSNDIAGPAYSLHNVERIEIIWGPASALYGANAFGGVIHIITKKGADINGIYAERGFGTFNTSTSKINIGAAKGRFDLAISGSLYSTDGPAFKNRDPHYSGSYVDNAYSLMGALSYMAPKSTTTLGLRAYQTPMGWGTFFNSPTQLLDIPDQGNGNVGLVGLLSRDIRGENPGRISPYARTAYIQNDYKPNEKFNLISRLAYRETGIGEDSYAYLAVDGQKLYRIITASYSNRVSTDLLLSYNPSPKHRLSVGFQGFMDDVERSGRRATIDTATIYAIENINVTNLNSTFLPRLRDTRKNIGGYAQYVLSTNFLNKTNITVGGRYDYNDYFGDALSPRLAIVNQPDDRFTFKLQYGKAFRAPTNTEIYQAPTNFKLKTEKIETYEFNVQYTFSGSSAIQVNAFHNLLKDVILLGNLSNLTVNKNPGEFRTKGIEARLDMKYSEMLSAYLNLTLQDAQGKNLTTGFEARLPGVATFKTNAGINARIKDLFNFNLTGNWVGRRGTPSTSPLTEGVAGYFLMHASLNTKQFLHDKVSVSFTVNNMFDNEWFDPGFRTADGLLFSTVLEQPGRTGLFKIAVKL